MSLIKKSLLGLLFNGATVALADAPWKNNVRAIYGFNAAGTGYEVFKPGNPFNSLIELKQDGAYIVDVATPGFELPGATLVVAPGAVASGPGPQIVLEPGYKPEFLANPYLAGSPSRVSYFDFDGKECWYFGNAYGQGVYLLLPAGEDHTRDVILPLNGKPVNGQGVYFKPLVFETYQA